MPGIVWSTTFTATCAVAAADPTYTISVPAMSLSSNALMLVAFNSVSNQQVADGSGGWVAGGGSPTVNTSGSQYLHTGGGSSGLTQIQLMTFVADHPPTPNPDGQIYASQFILSSLGSAGGTLSLAIFANGTAANIVVCVLIIDGVWSAVSPKWQPFPPPAHTRGGTTSNTASASYPPLDWPSLFANGLVLGILSARAGALTSTLTSVGWNTSTGGYLPGWTPTGYPFQYIQHVDALEQTVAWIGTDASATPTSVTWTLPTSLRWWVFPVEFAVPAPSPTIVAIPARLATIVG